MENLPMRKVLWTTKLVIDWPIRNRFVLNENPNVNLISLFMLMDQMEFQKPILHTWYEYIQFHDPLCTGGAVGGGVEPLSTDSGLSSIRVEESADEIAVADDFDVQELNGLKQRLIEETEGEICTKILYHFENEKVVIRVPGWPPILASFQQSMYYHGDYRYFVRQREAWVEVTERNEPVYAVNGQAEVKVISKV